MTNDRPDPQHVLFEIKELTRQFREAPTDPVVAGALISVLDRAAALRFYPGMPHEVELREAFSDLSFLARDWWRGPGALLYGPDVAQAQARQCEILGHIVVMTVGEVSEQCLTRRVNHDLQ